MEKIQFRILYREFLFRMVDLELLSAHAQGDMSKLLGQFAALLVFFSVWCSLGALGIGGNNLIAAWSMEHFLIATTMLAVGLFAVLSWDSTFPDRRDVLVLAPLPLRTRTLFLAKVAASATALSVTVAALNSATGIALPMVLAPWNNGLLDLVLSFAPYRAFAAYWIAMLSAGAFVFCSVLCVQGLGALVLPYRRFLRLSSFLQMAAFCFFICVYFFEPSLTTPRALAAAENQRLLAWLPSYWFLGLFQQLNGSMPVALAPLAWRAWTGLAVAGCGAGATFLLSYFRTLKKIVEEPDIMPDSHGMRWLPRFGNSLATAIVQFSIRTLLRSRRHRMMLAFYLGAGFALVILIVKGGVAHGLHLADPANAPLLFASLIMMCFWIVGTRVVFSMPLALRANWIFRVTEIRGAREYLSAIRRTLFILAAAPVWLASAAFFLAIWPWRPAAAHLVVMGLWGIALAYISLRGFQKIPFACSYLPGKSFFHMAFVAAAVLAQLIGMGVDLESRALHDPPAYARMLVVLIVAALLAGWRTVALAKSEEATVQFEELASPAILVLGLHRDGVLPVQPRST